MLLWFAVSAWLLAVLLLAVDVALPRQCGGTGFLRGNPANRVAGLLVRGCFWPASAHACR